MGTYIDWPFKQPKPETPTKEKGRIWLRDRNWRLITPIRVVRNIRYITPTQRVGEVNLPAYGGRIAVREFGDRTGSWRPR